MPPIGTFYKVFPVNVSVSTIGLLRLGVLTLFLWLKKAKEKSVQMVASKAIQTVAVTVLRLVWSYRLMACLE